MGEEIQGLAHGSAAAGLSIATGWRHLLISVSDGIDRGAKFLSVCLTLAFATVMAVGVFYRYALNSSLSFSDELALIVFIWAVFLAISSGYVHGRHVNIDFLVTKLPSPWGAWAHTLAGGLAGGYLICLVVSGIEALEIAAGARTDALRIPMTIPYFAVPCSGILMCIHWLRRNLAELVPRQAVVRIAIALTYFVFVFLPIGQFAAIEGGARTILLVVMLFGPMIIGVPVALCLGLMATLYVGIIGTIPFSTGAMQTFVGINAVALMAVPLLILAGKLMHAAGMARHLVDFAQVLVGRLPGGLGVANVVASFLFGDISGSAVSDTAAIGSLMIPQMKKRGYQAAFCAALQGTAGTLGMMAPLAITILLYGTAVNASIKTLAAATILPAFLVAGSFIVVVFVHAHRHNYPRENVSWDRLLPCALYALPPIGGLAVVLGGILGGVFTPAEVGSMLFFYVFFLSILFYKTLTPRSFYEAVVEAGYISGMTLFMVSTSYFLGFMMARDLVGMHMADFIAGITMNRYTIIFVVSLLFIVLGMVLEPPAMIFGFLPSFMPLLDRAGIDIIHWGVLFAVNMGMGAIIPPVALNLFVSTQLAEVKYEDAVRATVPFIIIMAADMAIMAIFPSIPLQLPHLLFGYPIK